MIINQFLIGKVRKSAHRFGNNPYIGEIAKCDSIESHLTKTNYDVYFRPNNIKFMLDPHLY